MSRDNDDPDSYEKGKEIFIRCCSCCHSIDNKQHKIGTLNVFYYISLLLMYIIYLIFQNFL